MQVGRFSLFILVEGDHKIPKKANNEKFVYSNVPDSPKVGGWMVGWIGRWAGTFFTPAHDGRYGNNFMTAFCYGSAFLESSPPFLGLPKKYASVQKLK